jgi:hypothetical protein
MDVGRRDFQGQSVEVDLSLLVASALDELNDNFGVCLARRKGKEPMLELVECFNPRPVGLRAAFGDAAKFVELIREGMVDLRYEFFSLPACRRASSPGMCNTSRSFGPSKDPSRRKLARPPRQPLPPSSR